MHKKGFPLVRDKTESKPKQYRNLCTTSIKLCHPWQMRCKLCVVTDTHGFAKESNLAQGLRML